LVKLIGGRGVAWFQFQSALQRGRLRAVSLFDERLRVSRDASRVPSADWLGREGSNLRMAESKSAWLFNDFNGNLEKMDKTPSSNFNSLAAISKWKTGPPGRSVRAKSGGELRRGV